MPRAKRTYLPGYVWHITHRCHNKEFLLKFQKDRDRWRYWLYQAKKRFGLCVLDFIVTSNHIHLLVQETKHPCIARSMQLIAGRVAQEFNKRKQRTGAFWEDRYFATAVSTDQHLHQCLSYIDLNMVRAGVVEHPSEWGVSGYNEIQFPRSRYRVIDFEALRRLTEIEDEETLRKQHYLWVQAELEMTPTVRDPKWTENVAVGSESFRSRFLREKADAKELKFQIGRK